MTLSEAELFLKLDNYGDPKEAYDFLVFEQRTFFAVKPCIPKVFRSKIDRLDRFIEAAKVLGLESGKSQKFERDFQLSDVSMFQYVVDYMIEMNKLKVELCASTTLRSIKGLANLQLRLFHKYSSSWPVFEDFSEELLLSSETDPVALVEQLKLLEIEGIHTFTQLSLLDNSVGQLVKREAVRLHKLHSVNPDAQRS